MYCGDETAALVGDLGSRTFKVGFAGEDTPKGFLPSCTGLADGADPCVDSRLVGQVELGSRCQGVDVSWVRKDGVVSDWDGYERLWDHGMRHVLNSDPKEHPVLIATPGFESTEDRSKIGELMFEKFETPAMYLAQNAMLSAFSAGRANALVVDVGATFTNVSPVQDGFVLKKSSRRSAVAGDVVDEHLVQLLETQVIPGEMDKKDRVDIPCVFERNCMNRDNVSASYRRWQKLKVVEDIKASVCRIWTELNFDEAAANMYVKERYELPDGTVIHLGAERFKSPELLMNPKGVVKSPSLENVPVSSLPSVVRDSVQSVHVDLRRDLVQQIMLVGAGSILPGTAERLQKELVHVLPSALKPRILTPSKQERVFSTFIGASILATLGSFQQMWISKQEYEENGASSLKVN
mmetsp:Transcript_6325/g.9987  ORF Transcript_6325/g.9987 Transcript_6325/m.9987 type:complete len:408 (-) Transcript_6325:388-1611(-)|eukprot:CAMPEP_0203795996 /NCGR_PEP_ID=MMETSP0100_2-20121128/7620_1 /ASSEMBLY_ACC=CAM_ASM_000210 /TAXON_ID=96639 /ORGANISM=" , Strain NY0313808BC1" /LENGTH=407 /DNA_ID=CAMNT_0050700727 /DNA_START=142 /DNA_END=1365 /DNA_ORIENTATION=+